MSLLKWAAIFFILSLIAAAFGFGGIATGAGNIAQILFYLFIGLCVLLLVLGVAAYKKVTR